MCGYRWQEIIKLSPLCRCEEKSQKRKILSATATARSDEYSFIGADGSQNARTMMMMVNDGDGDDVEI